MEICYEEGIAKWRGEMAAYLSFREKLRKGVEALVAGSFYRWGREKGVVAIPPVGIGGPRSVFSNMARARSSMGRNVHRSAHQVCKL
jgi:hypothetical protein